jgi:hypothetical protein
LLLQGGIYLDTDVEVVGRFDRFLQHRSFWGFEAANYVATSTMGCLADHEILAEYLAQYDRRHFSLPDGSLDLTSNVVTINQILKRHGLMCDGQQQTFGQENQCYPMAVFSPYNYLSGEERRTSDTVAVHRFQYTWGSPFARCRRSLVHAIAALAASSGLGTVCNRLRSLANRQ